MPLQTIQFTCTYDTWLFCSLFGAFSDVSISFRRSSAVVWMYYCRPLLFTVTATALHTRQRKANLQVARTNEEAFCNLAPFYFINVLRHICLRPGLEQRHNRLVRVQLTKRFQLIWGDTILQIASSRADQRLATYLRFARGRHRTHTTVFQIGTDGCELWRAPPPPPPADRKHLDNELFCEMRNRRWHRSFTSMQ